MLHLPIWIKCVMRGLNMIEFLAGNMELYRLWQAFLHLATEVLVCEMEGDPDSQDREIVLNVSKKKKKSRNCSSEKYTSV